MVIFITNNEISRIKIITLKNIVTLGDGFKSATDFIKFY